jgi:hypothetical protein
MQVPDECIYSSSPPPGYTLPICESMVAGSVACSVPPTCSTGWTGSATVTCGQHGAELTFSGCAPNVCTAIVTGLAGYASLPVCEERSSGAISCSQAGSCAAGYTYHTAPAQSDLTDAMGGSAIEQGAYGFYVLPHEGNTEMGPLGCPEGREIPDSETCRVAMHALNPAWVMDDGFTNNLQAHLAFPPGCSATRDGQVRFNPRKDSVSRSHPYFPVCQYPRGSSGDISCDTDGAELSANSCIPPTCRPAEPSRAQCLADCTAAGKGSYWISPFSTGRAVFVDENGDLQNTEGQFLAGGNFPSCAMGCLFFFSTAASQNTESCTAVCDDAASGSGGAQTFENQLGCLFKPNLAENDPYVGPEFDLCGHPNTFNQV